MQKAAGEESASSHYEGNHVAAGPLQHGPNHLGDEHAADGAGHAADADYGAYGARGKHIRGQSVEIRGKALVRGGGEADYENRGPKAFDSIRENDGSDAEGANEHGEFTGGIDARAMTNQPRGEPAAGDAADVGN